MVSKFKSHSNQEQPPSFDENWWAALMAEEEKAPVSAAHRSSSPAITKHEPQNTAVNWDKACQLYEQDQAICMEVAGYNRGGLLVEGEDLQGFVPFSHLLAIPVDEPEEEREDLLAEFVGQTLELKIIECDPERGRVVFSQRAALSKPGSRTNLLHSLEHGDRVSGTITNITDFGVFVDLGGVEGLIHVSELSWGRVRHPRDTVRLGQRVDVFVIQVDEERARVALSLKRLCPNPWETAAEHYQVGMVVDAIITSVLPYGAFARLENGLDGLIHISEMGTRGEIIRPTDYLYEGQHVQVRILHIEPPRQRLGLSLRLD